MDYSDKPRPDEAEKPELPAGAFVLDGELSAPRIDEILNQVLVDELGGDSETPYAVCNAATQADQAAKGNEFGGLIGTMPFSKIREAVVRDTEEDDSLAPSLVFIPISEQNVDELKARIENFDRSRAGNEHLVRGALKGGKLVIRTLNTPPIPPEDKQAS